MHMILEPRPWNSQQNDKHIRVTETYIPMTSKNKNILVTTSPAMVKADIVHVGSRIFMRTLLIVDLYDIVSSLTSVPLQSSNNKANMLLGVNVNALFDAMQTWLSLKRGEDVFFPLLCYDRNTFSDR